MKNVTFCAAAILLWFSPSVAQSPGQETARKTVVVLAGHEKRVQNRQYNHVRFHSTYAISFHMGDCAVEGSTAFECNVPADLIVIRDLRDAAIADQANVNTITLYVGKND